MCTLVTNVSQSILFSPGIVIGFLSYLYILSCVNSWSPLKCLKFVDYYYFLSAVSFFDIFVVDGADSFSWQLALGFPTRSRFGSWAGDWSALNSLSCSWKQWDLTFALWHGTLSSWKQSLYKMANSAHKWVHKVNSSTPMGCSFQTVMDGFHKSLEWNCVDFKGGFEKFVLPLYRNLMPQQ